MVPSKPWISNNNSISDDNNNNNKLTTTIRINNQQLKQLRMKYGIITEESNSINEEDSLIENIRLIDLKPTINDNENDTIQKKLHSIQSIIRKELIKVETFTNVNKNQCTSCQNCSKQETIAKELIDYFQKQDAQLREMNVKINQILNIYQNENQIKSNTQQQHRTINNQPVLSILQCNSEKIALDMKMDAKTNLKNYLGLFINEFVYLPLMMIINKFY